MLPILTEHVDAQFCWMLEAHPDQAERRARYLEDSGLGMSLGPAPFARERMIETTRQTVFRGTRALASRQLARVQLVAALD